MNFLNPGKNCENIRSRISSDFPEEFCNSEFDNKENVPTTKMGCRRKLRPLEEFFIVLCRLRRGFSEWHLANLYGVAQQQWAEVLSSALILCTWSLDKSAFGHLHVMLFYNTNHPLILIYPLPVFSCMQFTQLRFGLSWSQGSNIL